MKAIEYEENRSLNLFFKMFVIGMFREVMVLLGRGIGLGLVLFLALSTLSLLNRGMDFLDRSSKSNVGSVVKRQSFPAASQISVSPYRVAYQPYSSGAYTRVNKTQDARDAIRESGYFVGSVESFVRALTRFSK